MGLASGAGELPTTFRFESNWFWFPVALGAIYLFSSFLAHARGGCWGAECGVRGAAFAFPERRRPRRQRGVVGSGARGGPGLPTPLESSGRAGVRGADPGPRGPGLLGIPPAMSTPHAGSLSPVLAHNLGVGGSAEDSAATAGTFPLRSSSLEILPDEEWDVGRGLLLLSSRGGGLRGIWW